MAIEFRRDGPWELPEGWVWARLGDLVALRGEKAPPDRASPFPFIGMDNVPSNSLRIETMGEFRTMKSAGNKFYPNDILYGRLRPYLNKVVVSDLEGVASGEFIVLRAPDGIAPRYLQLFMHSRYFVNLATSDTSGDRPRIDFDKIAGIEIPVAPKAEQHRIVARIDELFTEIADGETALARARDDLDTWRRALLKAAVTGELTWEWREHNKVNETGLDVLSVLRGSRIGLRSVQRSQEVTSAFADHLPDLPDGWAWTTLGEIAESVRNGFSNAPRADRNQHEILRISAVRPMLVDLTQIRYLSAEQAAAARSFIVEPGDFLFTRYNGSADLVGVGALYRDNPRYYPDKLIRVRLWSDLREYARYFEVAVNTWISRKHIAANIKTTAGQQGLSGESLKYTPIPLPPRAEVLAIMKAIDGVENDTVAELAAIDRAAPALRHSVLKAAFEGRLVAQDSRDESAEALVGQLDGRAAQTTPTSDRSGRRSRGAVGADA